MQQFIEQAKHNQLLHDTLHAAYPDQFNDWKITILFYVAIHYLKALAAKQKRSIGETHYDIKANIKPPRFAGDSPTMPLTLSAFNIYQDLLKYSQTARYVGVKNSAVFEQVRAVDHAACLRLLANFKLYLRDTRGLIEID